MSKFYTKQSKCVGEPLFYKLHEKNFKKAHQGDPCRAWILVRDYSKTAKMRAIQNNCEDLGIEPPAEVKEYLDNLESVITDKIESDMMMIYSHKQHGGYARYLMTVLQDIFKCIRTEWGASTKDGRAFCMKMGFKHEGDLLVWTKEEK